MPDPARILQEAYDHVRRDYRTALGQQRDELITPALVLDIDAAQRNIDHMASELKQMGAATIRPHYKTHKNPDLARRQLQAGAGGLSMASSGHISTASPAAWSAGLQPGRNGRPVRNRQDPQVKTARGDGERQAKGPAWNARGEPPNADQLSLRYVS